LRRSCPCPAPTVREIQLGDGKKNSDVTGAEVKTLVRCVCAAGDESDQAALRKSKKSVDDFAEAEVAAARVLLW